MQKPSPVRFRFGQFEANLLSGTLFEDGKPVSLQEKPFQLLAAVLQGLGNVVTREEVAARMWPHTHVQTDQGLNAATRKVRLALGDSSEAPKYIETLGSRGYRFIHPYEIFRTAEASGLEEASVPMRVAVLPTDDQDGVLENQARGFSSELVERLRSVTPQMTVVSNGDLRGRDLRGRSVEEIGRELQVHYVVSARVRRIRNDLRLTIMLFHAEDPQCVWAETYEQAPEDFVKNRCAFADKVAHSLRPKLIQRHD